VRNRGNDVQGFDEIAETAFLAAFECCGSLAIEQDFEQKVDFRLPEIRPYV
jgi:hypothetical protein